MLPSPWSQPGISGWGERNEAHSESQRLGVFSVYLVYQKAEGASRLSLARSLKEAEDLRDPQD